MNPIHDDAPHHYRPTREGRCDTCGRAPRSHRATDAAADAYYASVKAARRGELARTRCYCLALYRNHYAGDPGCAFNADWSAR